MPKTVFLIGHEKPPVIALARSFADRNGFEARVITSGRSFSTEYNAAPPVLILYEFFMEHLDGIELVQWLIDQKNTAKVVMTAASSLNVTGAATEIARNAGLFPLTVLHWGATEADILDALEADTLGGLPA